MKKASCRRWSHYRETPFEVMSVILFSALVFSAPGKAQSHPVAPRESQVHRVQSVLAQHTSSTQSAKAVPAQQG